SGHLARAILHLGDLGSGRAQGRETGELWLERQSRFENLTRTGAVADALVVGRHAAAGRLGAKERALPDMAPDQAVRLQSPYRSAQPIAREAEPIGELALGRQPLLRSQRLRGQELADPAQVLIGLSHAPFFRATQLANWSTISSQIGLTILRRP